MSKHIITDRRHIRLVEVINNYLGEIREQTGLYGIEFNEFLAMNNCRNELIEYLNEEPTEEMSETLVQSVITNRADIKITDYETFVEKMDLDKKWSRAPEEFFLEFLMTCLSEQRLRITAPMDYESEKRRDGQSLEKKADWIEFLPNNKKEEEKLKRLFANGLTDTNAMEATFVEFEKEVDAKEEASFFYQRMIAVAKKHEDKIKKALR